MRGEMIQQAGPELIPVLRERYTESLLARAAQTQSIPAKRLEEIREELHRAAAARIGSFTDGLVSSVSREQAEQFYLSLLCQLDAVLLRAESDEQAEAMLREVPLRELLQKGMHCTIEDFTEAKELFRAAFPVLHRFETILLSSTLEEFSVFITQYDARTRAEETGISFLYPAMDGVRPAERGAAGVCRYYAKLRGEAEVLSCFPAEMLSALFRRYAALYLTDAYNIAENLGEIVLRHWFIAALAGDAESRTVDLTEEMLSTVAERFGGSPPAAFRTAMERVLQLSFFAELPPLPDGSTVSGHILAAVPQIAQQLHRRLDPLRLSGYLAVVPA